MGRKQKMKKKGKQDPGLQRAWIRATAHHYDGKIDFKAANAALRAAKAQEIPPDDLIRARKMAQAALLLKAGPGAKVRLANKERGGVAS